jgi:hypothetical protein
MFLINQDPENIVPNIREDFIDTRVILLHVTRRYKGTIDNWYYVPRKVNNNIVWYGSHTSANEVHDWEVNNSVISKSLIELLIKTYKYLSNEWFSFSIYVINDRTELLNIVNEINIKNKYLLNMILNRNINIFK